MTAFALFLAVPLWAQRGGGGHGGGGHAGFGGGHAGFSGGHIGGFGGRPGFSGVHAYSGMRSGIASSRGFNRGFSNRTGRGPFLHNGFGGSRFRGNSYGLRNNCYGGYGCWGYGYPWWGDYYPWWWDDDSADDSDYYQNLGIANQMNQESLEEQQMRQQEEADGDQDAYIRPPRRIPSAAGDDKAGEAVLPPTVLVFRDQHKEEIHNYAIVGQTLWNFSPQRTERISLADLDLAATTKANEDRGVTFRVPGAGETPAVPPVHMQGHPTAPAVNQS